MSAFIRLAALAALAFLASANPLIGRDEAACLNPALVSTTELPNGVVMKTMACQGAELVARQTTPVTTTTNVCGVLCKSTLPS